MLSLLCVATFVVLLAGVNVLSIRRAKQSFSRLNQETIPTVNLLNNIKTSGFRVQQEILSLLIQSDTQTTHNPSDLEELVLACDSFKTSLGTLEALFSSPQLGYTQQLQSILDEYGHIAEQISDGLDSTTILSLQTQLQANEEQFVRVIDQALSDAIQSYEKTQEASFSFLNAAIAIGIGAILVALALSLILGQLLSKFILRPLRSLTTAAHHFGKTTQDISLSHRENLKEVAEQEDEVGLLASTFLDMNKRVSVLNTKLGFEASHDTLTSIPNRISFHRALTKAVKAFQETKQPFTVLFLDFDRFKDINDSYGHRVGDELLRAIAKRLKELVRASDVLARLGGDEFTILLNATPLAQASEIAERIHQHFLKPLIAGEQSIVMTLSIGMVEMETECQDANTILRDADLAMYHAKNKGRGFSESFRPCMHNLAMSRVELEQDLRRAISNQELEVYYQPIHHATTAQLTGFEALVRWNHPQKGLIPPLDFLFVAEETGLIKDIDHWVLDTACKQMLSWQIHFKQPYYLSVNFSGAHFREKNLPERLLQRLESLEFAPSHLNIELTEGILIESSDIVLESLRALRSKGIHIHLDDFGTGYSSLSYVQRFPIDVLKIDKSFVQTIHDSQENLAIVRAILAMAESLNVNVLAEGIELASQAKILAKEGCDRLQGYFFAKPMTSEAAAVYLEAWQPAKPLEASFLKNKSSSIETMMRSKMTN